MRLRHAIVLLALFGSAAASAAADFTIQDVGDAHKTDVAQIKAGTIVFSDHTGASAVDSETALFHFDDWAEKHPIEKKFLALYPGYTEPTDPKVVNGTTSQVLEKLYMYVAQARFVLDKPPSAIDLSRYVSASFLQKIDPAITHQVLAPTAIGPFNDESGTGNQNPDRPWCTGRTTSICIQSSYKLEGKIPMGILLVNKLREGSKKVPDHIDFQSELSALGPADLDQAALQELTTLNTPVSGVLEQDLFYINQILKFGKFFGVFQAAPNDDNKTVVTAFMSLAIKASVLDEKRGYETMPVLRNLVPAQVLMGQSSFNSGNSISAGLPLYARNEIKTIAGILQRDK
ncbi:MAG TPA: hypothetical protein VHU22_10725 [Xanthobacteraceae bacterium]|jgi:hypothetical protein|nr:hypothetical protein [Xanthobacteraceae bacterium]